MDFQQNPSGFFWFCARAICQVLCQVKLLYKFHRALCPCKLLQLAVDAIGLQIRLEKIASDLGMKRSKVE